MLTVEDMRVLSKKYKALEDIASKSWAMDGDAHAVATIAMIADIVTASQKDCTESIIKENDVLRNEISKLVSAVTKLANSVENLSLSSTNNQIETMQAIKKIPASLSLTYHP